MTPVKQETIDESPNLYRSIGFVLGRMQAFVVFIPYKATDDFRNEFLDVEGRMPSLDEPGVVIHPEGVDKYWMEYRITFRASERETLVLFLGYQWVVKGNQDKTLWNLNNNAFLRRLREMGFQLGRKQNWDTIESNIPAQYKDSFLDGLIKAGKP